MFGNTTRIFLTYLRPYRIRFLVLAFFLISSILLQLVGPLLLERFIDAANSKTHLGYLFQLASFYLITAFITQVISIAEAYAAEDLAWLTTNALRTDLLLHCLRLDMSFHHTYTSGELTQRIDGDISTLANFFTRFVIALLGQGLLLVGMIIVLYIIDWRIGLPLTLFVLFAIWLFSRVRTLLTGTWDEALQTRSSLFGPRGVKLSGGQIQRTALARAVVREAELYCIDDASSALDRETEQLIWEQLLKQKDKTYLVVSHRPALLRAADTILVLDDGHLVAQGTCDELRETSPLFQDIWNHAFPKQSKM